jgi:FAD/FMN-containing dehydrogenase
MDTADITGRLQSVLDDEHISRDGEDIDSFRVSSPIIDPGTAPSHVARPSGADQLQGLVRLANQHTMNLTVASSTGAHSKGGLAASKSSVLVDLSSWKNVAWLNRRNRVCLIEPGVTYGELLRTLEPVGLTIPVPLAPREGKSVVAAVMDREPSTWPNRQWDSGDPVASTEFIFGSGELFRTGAAGGPGSLEQQRESGGAQKSSAGPSQTDFHRVVQGSQGTMGIVTWITMRAELKPTVEKPFLLGADSLDNLIHFVYEVQRPWLGEHSFLLDRTAAAMLMSADASQSFDGIRNSLPNYVCLQNIAGFERMPKKRVDYQQKDIESIAQRHRLSMTASLGSISASDLLRTATSPSGESDWRHWVEGHCLSVLFLTTLDRVPGMVEMFVRLAKSHNADRDSIGCYIQPVVQNHACHVELMFMFDPKSEGGVETARIVEKEAVSRLAEEGAFFSRPYGSAADVVFKQNPLNYDILRKAKHIFDPNSVLNNGKWGL